MVKQVITFSDGTETVIRYRKSADEVLADDGTSEAAAEIPQEKLEEVLADAPKVE